MKNPFLRNELPEKSRSGASTSRAASNDKDRTPPSFYEPSTLQYSWAVDPEISFESKGTRKKSGKNGVGRLVKKLNCAASSAREADNISQNTNTFTHRQVEKLKDPPRRPIKSQEEQTNKSSLWNCATPQASPAGASRDVVITVSSNNVNMGRMSASTFSPPRYPGSPRKNEGASMSARKERWLKGLQRGYANDAHFVPRRISGGESIANYGCVQTAAPSLTSYDSDFTTEVSSDDSDNYKQTAPGERDPHRRNRSTRIPDSTIGGGDDLWAGVAEDIGIIAGIILFDGTACIGSVADITQETVSSGCEPMNDEY